MENYISFIFDNLSMLPYVHVADCIADSDKPCYCLHVHYMYSQCSDLQSEQLCKHHSLRLTPHCFLIYTGKINLVPYRHHTYLECIHGDTEPAVGTAGEPLGTLTGMLFSKGPREPGTTALVTHLLHIGTLLHVKL